MISDDLTFMSLAWEEAKQAAARDEVPIGAVIVDPTSGNIIARNGNRTRELKDPSAHAEILVIREACEKAGAQRIPELDLYVTLEPCAMCAGAIYWVGTGRLVYGMSEKQLKEITGNHPENPTLDLPCESVFAAGQRKVEVIGPMLV
ncbi:MAG: nucleoside deaminase, partial [Alphaproteobacteria bacterium]|nr:nucleoside deaminase [Alphaproteobacteria bacterium]